VITTTLFTAGQPSSRSMLGMPDDIHLKMIGIIGRAP
jgi:hypothetical protein